VTGFQCVANNHCCDCKKTECGKHVHGPDSVRKKLGITFGEETNMHGDGWPKYSHYTQNSRLQPMYSTVQSRDSEYRIQEIPKKNRLRQ